MYLACIIGRNNRGEQAMAIKGKTVLVTGASGGIGEAFARAFAHEGCNIVFNGLGEPAAIEKLRAEIAKQNNVEVMYHAADVGKPDEVEAMIAAALKQFGVIDIVINNAVTRHYAPVEAFPVDK